MSAPEAFGQLVTHSLHMLLCPLLSAWLVTLKHPVGLSDLTEASVSALSSQQACLLTILMQPFRDFLLGAVSLWPLCVCVSKPVGNRLVVTGLGVALPNPLVSGHFCMFTVLEKARESRRYQQSERELLSVGGPSE